MKRFPLCVAIAMLWALPTAAGPSQVGGRTSPDGSEAIAIDLPGVEHMRNTGGMGRGGPGTGAGLCVFTSVEHAGRWQNEERLRGFQGKMRHEPGGGWPEKLDRMIEKHAPGVQYVQYTGSDPAILKLAIKTGRMVSVTYGAAHMVNLVHLSDKWAACLDNNTPGENRYIWMAPSEFYARWRYGGGAAWAVVLLNPPPPPVPVNLNPTIAEVPWPAGRVIGARWGTAFCAPVGAPVRPKPQWHPWPGYPGWYLLYDGQWLLGSCSPDGKYQPWERSRQVFGQVKPAPIPLPLAAENHGLERGHIPDRECYSICGIEVTQRAAFIAITGGPLVDDSHKLRVTVIGKDRQQVIDDLAKHDALAPWRDKVLVQGYDSEAWAVRGVGFETAGSPRIVVQAAPGPDGRAAVLHSQAGYEGGAEHLAEALRKSDPTYDPRKDPDRRRPADPEQPAPGPGGHQFPSLPNGCLPICVGALVGTAVATFRWWGPWLRRMAAERVSSLDRAEIEKLIEDAVRKAKEKP